MADNLIDLEWEECLIDFSVKSKPTPPIISNNSDSVSWIKTHLTLNELTTLTVDANSASTSSRQATVTISGETIEDELYDGTISGFSSFTIVQKGLPFRDMTFISPSAITVNNETTSSITVSFSWSVFIDSKTGNSTTVNFSTPSKTEKTFDLNNNIFIEDVTPFSTNFTYSCVIGLSPNPNELEVNIDGDGVFSNKNGKTNGEDIKLNGIGTKNIESGTTEYTYESFSENSISITLK